METSAISLATADLRAARRHAIIYVLSASATFTLGSAVVKALTADFPVLEIVMYGSDGLQGRFPKSRIWTGFGQMGAISCSCEEVGLQGRLHGFLG